MDRIDRDGVQEGRKERKWRKRREREGGGGGDLINVRNWLDVLFVVGWLLLQFIPHNFYCPINCGAKKKNANLWLNGGKGGGEGKHKSVRRKEEQETT